MYRANPRPHSLTVGHHGGAALGAMAAMTSAMASVAASSDPPRVSSTRFVPGTMRSNRAAPSSYASARTMPRPPNAFTTSPDLHSSPTRFTILSTTGSAPRRPNAIRELSVSIDESISTLQRRARRATRTWIRSSASGRGVRHRRGVGELVVGREVDHRPNLVPAARVYGGELPRELDRVVLRVEVDDVEPEDLLLCLGVGPIGDHEGLAVLPDRARGGRRSKPCNRTELPLAGELFLHGDQLLHDGAVLFLGPGGDHRLGVVAENRVKHWPKSTSMKLLR